MCNEPLKQNNIEPNRLEHIKSLHSRYDPQREAERYITSLSLGKNIRFFILIEPGLGYITASLKKKFPDAKIIALHIEKPVEEILIEKPHSHWYSQKEIAIQDFLETEVPDSKSTEIRLLEWRPAISMYGDAYLNLVRETAAFIKRADANARTTDTFGRLWFKNFFRNLDVIKTVLSPLHFSTPVLVTGAGPGLEYVIPEIRKKRDSIFILSCSSSVPALTNENIIPDMVISTDGTRWAKFHLYEIFRGNRKPLFPLAAALSASLLSQCEALSVMPISDGSLWQTLILNELKIPFISLPQRGTVTASALDLAFTLSDGNIFIAGIDLANSDIRSHVRPYSLDYLMEGKAERKNPLYSQVYKRSTLLKQGGAYDVYASWFKNSLSYIQDSFFLLEKIAMFFRLAKA